MQVTVLSDNCLEIINIITIFRRCKAKISMTKHIELMYLLLFGLMRPGIEIAIYVRKNNKIWFQLHLLIATHYFYFIDHVLRQKVCSLITFWYQHTFFTQLPTLPVNINHTDMRFTFITNSRYQISQQNISRVS